MKTTPLIEHHRAMSPRLMEFGGWLMPLQYRGIQVEHEAVRTHVGVFDVSHMGKFWLLGEGVLAGLSKLVPTDLSHLKDGDCQYTVLLNPSAGILDDIVVYRVKADQWLLIVNAATTEKDWQWLAGSLEATVTRQDVTAETMLLAVQGPAAVATVETLLEIPLTQLRRFQHAWDPQTSVLVARTGYTGEDGVEVFCPTEIGIPLWERLMTLGIQPCGLGCRDTLRLEAGMHLYGQDMDEMTTPVEASLTWLLTQKESSYVGQAILQAQLQQAQQGSPTLPKFVGMEMQGRAIARSGYLIFAEAIGGDPIGRITSGTQSPTLKKPIAMGYVPLPLAKVGSQVWVEVRGQRHLALVVKRPFYRG